MTDLSTSDLDLEAIEKRADEATPGPWRWEATDGGRLVAPLLVVVLVDGEDYDGVFGSPADRDFIAAARTDVPALVAALREARTRAQAAESLLEIRCGEDCVVADLASWKSRIERAAIQQACYDATKEVADLRAKLAASESRYQGLLVVLTPGQDEVVTLRARLAEWQAWAEDTAQLQLDQTDPDARLPDGDARDLIRDNCHDLVIICGALAKAEAAAGQMRAALESARVLTPRSYPIHADFDAALATDSGRGWVSPEAHAEVVRERDAMGAVSTDLAHDVIRERERAEKAEARVALLEAVVSCARIALPTTHTVDCEGAPLRFYERGILKEVSSEADCDCGANDVPQRFREALAALDAAPTSGPRGGR